MKNGLIRRRIYSSQVESFGFRNGQWTNQAQRPRRNGRHFLDTRTSESENWQFETVHFPIFGDRKHLNSHRRYTRQSPSATVLMMDFRRKSKSFRRKTCRPCCMCRKSTAISGDVHCLSGHFRIITLSEERIHLCTHSRFAWLRRVHT